MRKPSPRRKASGAGTPYFRSRSRRPAEHFRGRRLIKAGFGRGNAQGLKHIQRAGARYLRGKHGLISGGGDKGLSREVVHLIRLSILHDANEAGKIDKVPVDEV